MDLAYAM